MFDPLRSLPGLLRRPLVAALLIGVTVFAAVIAIRSAGWLVSGELWAYDNFLRSRRAESEPVVAMVWVTEQDIQRYGHPLEDRQMAQALEAILAGGPRAVGIDIYRPGPSGEGWDDLARIFASNPQLVVVEKLPDATDPGVTAPSFLQDRGQVGFADALADEDGVARRMPLFLAYEDLYLASFSVRLAIRFLAYEQIAMGPDPECLECIMFGPTSVRPLDPHFGGYHGMQAEGHQTLIDYRHWEGFPSTTFGEVIEGRYDPALFRDKVVIVGTAASSVKDSFQIPSGFARSGSASGARVYGAAVHAHVVDQLVRYGRGQDRPMRSWSTPLEVLWILLWSLGGAMTGVYIRQTLGLLAATAGGLGVLVGGLLIAFGFSWWLPVVPSAMGWLGSLGVGVTFVIQQERTDRRKMRGIFDKFLSPKLAESLWENKEIFWHGDRPRPQRAVATILMSDLFNYTTRSEKAEPSDVMEWLGVYTDRMTQLVDQHGGMVHDFLGDGLMASFGLPFPSEDEAAIDADAARAVECALAMGEVVRELNKDWNRDGDPGADLRLRVGLMTGPLVVGAIGGVDRMKYAAVGDVVNTAARLEAFDKDSFAREDSAWRILVGQGTRDRLDDRFETSCLGGHPLKGKNEKVIIHRVHGRPGEAPSVVGGNGAARGPGAEGAR